MRRIGYSLFGQRLRLPLARSYASITTASIANVETKDVLDAFAPIRDKLPSDGTSVTAAEFSAFLDTDFPSRTYNGFGLYTAREVALACPSLFKVVAEAETGWYNVARADESVANVKDVSKYVQVQGPTFVPLQDALTSEAADVPISNVLFALHTDTNIKVRTLVTIQPKAQPHGAHVFIDGDSLTKETVSNLFSTLKLTTVSSTRIVVRQASAAAHGVNDIVCRAPSQTFQLLENQLEALCSGTSIVLKPVIIFCGEAQRHIYASVAKKYGAKINVTLATPGTIGTTA